MMTRLGLDIGSKSIGWTLLKFNQQGMPTGIIAAGVRLFADGRDPKSKASLAEARRLARSMRRRRDRFLRRRDVLMAELVKAHLMPADEAQRQALEALDPYVLRAAALDKALPAYHLGRVFFHLNQRRGFLSNRKAERTSKNNEDGKINAALKKLPKAMEEANARTYGEFLYMRHRQGLDVRTRLRESDDEKSQYYEFYPDRAHLIEEFEKIWAAQQPHHPALMHADLKERLHYVIFGQRPLKVQPIGLCTFLDEERLSKAHPLFQERRLYEEVNALEVIKTGGTSRKLTRDERDKIIHKLRSAKTSSFAALRTLINLDENERFNKESENRTALKGDEVYTQFAHKSHFGSRWPHFDAATQWSIIQHIQEEENLETLLAWLMAEFDLDAQTAHAVAAIRPPEGYSRLGLTATTKILAELKSDVITYDKAVDRAGLGQHSDFRTGEIWDELPYYGEILDRYIPPGSNDPDDPEDMRFGRITNPTVHVGLNQVRHLVNQIIRVHGKPDEIVVELARELKLNEEQKREVNKAIKENTEAARKRSGDLIRLNRPDTGSNRALLKLWEELNLKNPPDRRCPYCGDRIRIEMLFSSEVDIDHILPYSKTLDDTPANKVIAHSRCNRKKGNRTPFDAFGHTPQWPAIMELADRLPKNKRWRFAPDALQAFEAQGGFEARQLKDTQYLSKMAHQYLSALYSDKGAGSSKVWVIPGRLIEMLRRNWGLNSLLPDHNFISNAHQKKNRLDHRHHAIDAAVIALTDRSLLQRLSRFSAQQEAQELERVVAKLDLPWPGFRDDLKHHLDAMVVSHKADHGTISVARRTQGRDTTAGRLHNDTAYGLTNEQDEKGSARVVRRVPLSALETPENLSAIRDKTLRKALEAATMGKDKMAFKASLRAFAKNPSIKGFDKIRRVRVLETLNVIPIHDAKGVAYKGYKGDANYCYEVWQLPDGKWVANTVTMFEAHQAASATQDRRPHPAARRVLKLFKDDLIKAAFKDGQETVYRVVKFSKSGNLVLAPHYEGGALQERDTNKQDPFKYTNTSASSLKKAQARQIRINPLGYVWDPGPRT